MWCRTQGSPENDDFILLALKWWAVQGIACASKADHKRVWDTQVEAALRDRQLPSAEHIDGALITCWPHDTGAASSGLVRD